MVSAGRPHEPNAPVNPPVDFTSTYTYRPSVEHPQVYAREGIPSFRPLEELIAGLEGGTRSAYCGSGMVAKDQERLWRSSRRCCSPPGSPPSPRC